MESVDLSQVLANDSLAVDTLRACLERRGWCFLEFPGDLQEEIQTCVENLTRFMSNNARTNYNWHPFGFHEDNHSQSFRIITGSELHTTDFPPSLLPSVPRLCTRVDTIAKKLLQHIGGPIFGLSPSDKSDDTQIGLFTPKTDGLSLYSYGLFDYAKYFNMGTGTREYNVAEHVDPGLFVLQLASVGPGLQLLDLETGNWIPSRTIGGLIWAGSLAVEMSGNRVKPGWHRVDYADRPRISLWYEVCTVNQVPPSIRRNGLPKSSPIPNRDQMGLRGGMQIFIKTLTGKLVSSGIKFSITHAGKKIEVVATGCDTVGYLKELLMYKEGIPPAKQRMICFINKEVVKLDNDEKTLEELGFQDGTVVHLVLSLKGGVKKEVLAKGEM